MLLILLLNTSKLCRGHNKPLMLRDGEYAGSTEFQSIANYIKTNCLFHTEGAEDTKFIFGNGGITCNELLIGS